MDILSLARLNSFITYSSQIRTRSATSSIWSLSKDSISRCCSYNFSTTVLSLHLITDGFYSILGPRSNSNRFKDSSSLLRKVRTGWMLWPLCLLLLHWRQISPLFLQLEERQMKLRDSLACYFFRSQWGYLSFSAAERTELCRLDLIYK